MHGTYNVKISADLDSLEKTFMTDYTVTHLMVRRLFHSGCETVEYIIFSRNSLCTDGIDREGNTSERRQ
jgi:hypothetical protein